MLRRTRSSRFVLWLVVTAVLAAGMIVSCSKDDNPVTSKPTQVQFVSARPDMTYEVQYDGKTMGTVNGSGNLTFETAPGRHFYCVKDMSSGCLSETMEVVATSGECVNVSLGSSSEPIQWVSCPKTVLALVLSGHANSLKTFVDNIEKGTLAPGGTLHVELNEGTHTCRFEDLATRCVSAPIAVTAAKGDTTRQVIGSGGWALTWADCPATQLTFRVSGSADTYEVTLDGQSAGVCSQAQPLTVEVTDGAHRFTLTSQQTGCVSQAFTVAALQGRTAEVLINSGQYQPSWVDCPLTKLRFDCPDSLSWALEVYLDGAKVGTLRAGAPLELEVQPGSHTLSYVDAGSGCESATTTISATPYATTPIAVPSNLQWVHCPPTQIVFSCTSSGSTYAVYLDGQYHSTLSSYGQMSTADVSPGSHSLYVVNASCGSVRSQTVYTNLAAYHKVTYGIPNDVTFNFPSPSGVGASDGSYDDYVYVTWSDGSTPAPSYEVYRAGSSGNYSYLATVSGTSFYDRNAAAFETYYYKVRGVWPCEKSSWSSSNSGYRRAAEFRNTRVEIDKVNRRVYLHTDLRLWGYMGRSMRLGGYWYRKSGSVYYYVQSKCSGANPPGHWLGHIWSYCIDPSSDKASYTDLWFSMSYDCFEKTGSYYGKIKLYRSCNVRDVNDPTYTQSDYCGITWGSGAPDAGGSLDEPLLSTTGDSETAAEDRISSKEAFPSGAALESAPEFDGDGDDDLQATPPVNEER